MKQPDTAPGEPFGAGRLDMMLAALAIATTEAIGGARVDEPRPVAFVALEVMPRSVEGSADIGTPTTGLDVTSSAIESAEGWGFVTITLVGPCSALPPGPGSGVAMEPLGVESAEAWGMPEVRRVTLAWLSGTFFEE